jgi:hypothetical protein
VRGLDAEETYEALREDLRLRVAAHDLRVALRRLLEEPRVRRQQDESIAFVARYSDDADEAVREAAALALGESRLSAGVKS